MEALHSEQLLIGLNELRQRQLLCDVVLKVESRQFWAHRAVLASCSPYFRAMFTGSLSETERKDIEFHSVEALAMELLLDFAYTGHVEITQGNVQNLLPAANLLQLKTVKEKCCNFLAAQLHPSNCIGISKFSEIHSCTDLHHKSSQFLMDNFVDVINCEEFLHLSEKEVCDIIYNDNLNVPSEDFLISAIETWIHHDSKARPPSFSNLFQCLRLPLLSMKQLKNLQDNHLLLKSNDNCQKLVKLALQYKTRRDFRLTRGHDKTFGLNSEIRRKPKALCAVGGKNGLFATLDSVECYLMEGGGWSDLAPLPRCRFECAAVTLDHHVYVLGGMVCDGQEAVSQRTHHSGMEKWDPDSDTWTQVAPMMHQRSALAVVTLCGTIYALGGYDGENYLSSVEKYCAKKNLWECVAPLLQSRSCFSAASLDGSVYAVGGYGPPCLNSVERYDADIDQWQFVSSMLEKRINFGIGVVRGLIYVVGGHNGAAYLGGMECYDPISNQWTKVCGMGQPRTGLAVVVIGDDMYAVGGHSGTVYLKSVQRYDPYSDTWHQSHSMATCRCSFGLTAI